MNHLIEGKNVVKIFVSFSTQVPFLTPTIQHCIVIVNFLTIATALDIYYRY